MMAALLAFAGYLAAPPDRVRRPLVLTGLFIGFGIATKWNAAYAAAFIGVVVVWRLARLARTSRRAPPGTSARSGLRAHLIWAPVGIYFGWDVVPTSEIFKLVVAQMLLFYAASFCS